MGNGSSTSTRRSYDQPCPVAHALDVVGERWTLLIVRDLLFGPLRFTDLRDGLPGLAPNLLSDRLRWLVGSGLVEQRELPPPAARTVYTLTPRGRDLGPVVHELSRFGVADWPDPDEAPPPARLVRGALLSLMSPAALGPGTWTATLDLVSTEVGVEVRSPAGATSPLDRLRLRQPPTTRTPDVVLTASLGTLVALHRDELSVDAAVTDDRLRVVGSPDALAEVAALFGVDPTALCAAAVPVDVALG